MQSNKHRGFTLIELLVVIAIIGVLASVVLASLNSARAKARDANRASQIREIQKALELYYADNGAYPPYGSSSQLSEIESSIVPQYIGAMPYDPTYGDTSNGYRYVRLPDASSYTILLRLETDDASSFCKLTVNGGWSSWNGFPTCEF